VKGEGKVDDWREEEGEDEMGRWRRR